MWNLRLSDFGAASGLFIKNSAIFIIFFGTESDWQSVSEKNESGLMQLF